MFISACPRTTVHVPHQHVHHWPKQEKEPLGWFPPGSYLESTPEEGRFATYKCRGITVEDLIVRSLQKESSNG